MILPFLQIWLCRMARFCFNVFKATGYAEILNEGASRNQWSSFIMIFHSVFISYFSGDEVWIPLFFVFHPVHPETKINVFMARFCFGKWETKKLLKINYHFQIIFSQKPLNHFFFRFGCIICQTVHPRKKLLLLGLDLAVVNF